MVQASIGETIKQGSFVQMRGRPWLVEELRGDGTDLETISLSCIADDAQGLVGGRLALLGVEIDKQDQVRRVPAERRLDRVVHLAVGMHRTLPLDLFPG